MMWKTARLGDLCTKVGSGATPRGGKESYKDSGIALIRSQNVYNNRFVKEGLAFIDDEQATGLANVEIEPDDVLLNITGDSVARVCQVPSEVLPARVNQHVATIRPDPSRLDPGFLRYWLVSPGTQAYMLALASAGATRKALTKGMIEGFEIPLPSLVIQRRIGHILGSLDDKIELNRRMNRTLEAIARAIFKSWFVDFDPVHAKADGREPVGMDPETVALFPDDFQDLPLGKIPKGWEVGCLGDIALHHRETMRPEAIESGMPYVALDDIPRGSISLSSWKNAEGLASSKSRFCEGDVLFGKLRPYFHKVVVAPTDGICSTDIVVIRAKQRQWAPLVLFLCSSKDFVAYNSAIMTGTKMPRTNWKDMSKYEITVPRSELASAFSRVVAPLVINTIRHTHECRRLAEVRDALLPRLVSGRSLKTAR